MFDVTPITSPKRLDCGATSLKMLLEYYGVDVPLDQLIEECHTTITGCTGKDVLRVGRAHGLDMKAYSMNAEELIRQDRPCIAWWQYMHFVVFAGVDDNGKVVVCNPDLGRYRMAPDTFKSFYAGVSFWNGEPEDLPESDIATAADYEHALTELGVEV